MTNIRFISAAFALGVGLTAALPALAGDVVQKTAVEVFPYELESTEGRAAVIRRIEFAADRLCTSKAMPLAESKGRADCIAATTETMIGQLGNVELLAQWKGERPVQTASRF